MRGSATFLGLAVVLALSPADGTAQEDSEAVKREVFRALDDVWKALDEGARKRAWTEGLPEDEVREHVRERDRRKGGDGIEDLLFEPEGERRGRGRGPRPCERGRGHPVWGIEWCANKGFSIGRDDVIRERVASVVLEPGDPEPGSGDLIEILGEIVFGKVQDRRDELNLAGELSGRWLDRDDPVLELTVGNLPFAAVVAADGGGVEVVLRR